MGMLEEILGSPAGWQQALRLAEEKALPQEDTLFLGSGSSYFLAQAAAHLARSGGRKALALPSAEAMLYPEAAGGFPLVVGISRSGQTTELLRAVRALGRQAWLITTRETGDHLFAQKVVLSEAQEEAIVQTRSFSSAFVYLAYALTGSEALRSLPHRFATHGAEEFPRGKRYFLLGSGVAWAVAQEAALKLKETALVWAEAFQSLEFRHGPKSLLDEESVVFLLESHPLEAPLAEEAGSLGAQVVRLPGELGELPLSLARLQLFAYRLALERGLDPNRPRHLTYAVRL